MIDFIKRKKILEYYCSNAKNLDLGEALIKDSVRVDYSHSNTIDLNLYRVPKSTATAQPSDSP